MGRWVVTVYWYRTWVILHVKKNNKEKWPFQSASSWITKKVPNVADTLGN